MIYSHFKDPVAGLILYIEGTECNTDLAVEVPWILCCRSVQREYRRDHLLGGGFTAGPGNTHPGDRWIPVNMCLRHLLQSPQGIRYEQGLSLSIVYDSLDLFTVFH